MGGHRKIHNVDLPSDIPRRWIEEVLAVPGVFRAEPYLIGVAEMRLPGGGFEYCCVVGVEPKNLVERLDIVEGEPRSILQTDGVFIDECEEAKLGNPRVGDLREIGGHRARVVGKTRGITGFLIMPYVFTTIDRASQYLRADGYLLVLPGATRPRPTPRPYVPLFVSAYSVGLPIPAPSTAVSRPTTGSSGPAWDFRSGPPSCRDSWSG